MLCLPSLIILFAGLASAQDANNGGLLCKPNFPHCLTPCEAAASVVHLQNAQAILSDTKSLSDYCSAEQFGGDRSAVCFSAGLTVDFALQLVTEAEAEVDAKRDHDFIDYPVEDLELPSRDDDKSCSPTLINGLYELLYKQIASLIENLQQISRCSNCKQELQKIYGQFIQLKIVLYVLSRAINDCANFPDPGPAGCCPSQGQVENALEVTKAANNLISAFANAGSAALSTSGCALALQAFLDDSVTIQCLIAVLLFFSAFNLLYGKEYAKNALAAEFGNLKYGLSKSALAGSQQQPNTAWNLNFKNQSQAQGALQPNLQSSAQLQCNARSIATFAQLWNYEIQSIQNLMASLKSCPTVCSATVSVLITTAISAKFGIVSPYIPFMKSCTGTKPYIFREEKLDA